MSLVDTCFVRRGPPKAASSTSLKSWQVQIPTTPPLRRSYFLLTSGDVHGGHWHVLHRVAIAFWENNRFNRSNHDWKGRFKVRNTTKLGEWWISSLVTTYIYILHVLVTAARIESNDDHEVVINGWHGAPTGAPTPWGAWSCHCPALPTR